MFTTEICQSACRAAHCWPIAHNIDTPLSLSMQVSFAASHVLDTPARFHMLSGQLEDIGRLKLNDMERDAVHEFVNLAVEKVSMYRDITPYAETLKKLHSRKVCKKSKRCRYFGEARVLTYKHVKEGLAKLARAEAERAEK